MYVEKQGDYSVKTGITSENKLADLPAQIHDIDFKTGYIPEGMKWADESHLEYGTGNATVSQIYNTSFLLKTPSTLML